jgi:hypothetical protein
MVAVLVLTYPIFFLFWLPIIIYQFVMLIGSPRVIWERMFEETKMSTELLIPEFNENRSQLIFH